MKRLTYRDANGEAWYSDAGTERDRLHRLAAYEDTGLEPEDIKQVCTEEAILKLAGQLLGITPDRLRELAEADREGRCVVLPRLEPGQGDPIGDKGVEGPPGLCPNCNDYRGIVWDEVTGSSRCTICGWTNAKT